MEISDGYVVRVWLYEDELRYVRAILNAIKAGEVKSWDYLDLEELGLLCIYFGSDCTKCPLPNKCPPSIRGRPYVFWVKLEKAMEDQYTSPLQREMAQTVYILLQHMEALKKAETIKVRLSSDEQIQGKEPDTILLYKGQEYKVFFHGSTILVKTPQHVFELTVTVQD
jgi:hypothetical protein